MILTLTPNPSLDRTIEVHSLIPGEVHRATSNCLDPGGKGVNVSRGLAANAVSTKAIVPAGGPEGSQLADLLAPAGFPVVTVPLHSPTRSNVTIVESDGTTTKINEQGPVLSAAEADAIAACVLAEAVAADWVVLSGSLPNGVPASYYADLVERAHALGCRVAVDSSGDALRAAVEAKPDLIKPNTDELAELTATPLRTWRDVAQQAQALQAAGIASVLVSLGSDGALLVDDEGVARAFSPPVTVRSTVGAGDATLAGFLAGGAKGSESLRMAVAFGAGAVTLPGSAMPTPTDIHPDRVTVQIEPNLAVDLHEVPA